MEFSLSLELAIFLFFVAIAAGFLDTLAGGGGLLTVPALLLTGMPPLAALGTNKFQAFFGTGTATYQMLKTQLVSFKECRYLMLAAFLGSGLGTVAVQFFELEQLKIIIPIVLALICIYFIVDPKIAADKPKLTDKQYTGSVVPIIGFYDGMFGPGTGTFYAMAGVALRAQQLIKSTAFAKTMNFATNIASFFVFAVLGQVIFYVGMMMIGGQLIGAFLGSKMLLNISRTALRLIIIIACLAMLSKYIWAEFLV